MPELMLLGYPLSTLFLYFCFYSCAGWCMETVYCSILEKRFVPRGFLHGPLCPIYGVGVLLMILFFAPLKGNLALFYIVSTVVMSAWEYFVGWFLEVTTHIKYWDYSMYRFNLHGRICLWVCLMWGVLSFLVLYFIHPRVAGLLERIPALAVYVLDGFFLGVLVSDAGATIYQLARTSQMLSRMQQVGDELRLQAHLGKAELTDMLTEAKQSFSERLDDLLPEQLDEKGRALKERYNDLMMGAELMSRRFRSRYSSMTSGRDREALESVKRQGEKGMFRRRRAKN